MSSPYLCVFDDDHVTCYIGADVDAGEQTDAWDGVGIFSGILFLVLCCSME